MSFPLLVARFTEDLERLGASVVGTAVNQKPARVRVVANDRVTDCLLFLWNVTHGGGAASRPRNERRVQLTATGPFTLEAGQRTIIGGWSDETGSWGFWDVMRHIQFSRKSPSLQINFGTLERGFYDGVATQAKARSTEIVVSVSPALLLWYVQDGAVLHNSGPDALEVPGLINADPEIEQGFLDAAEDAAQASRRFTLVETMRAVRDARFRPAVLQAYSNQCAVCPISLNLVDAAHIIPVSRPHSTDEVTNGLALCRLHHAAYDSGLLGVKSDHSIIINPRVMERLRTIGFDAGLPEFRNLLRASIRVPRQAEVRPLSEYLRLGMVERNWPQELVG